MNFELRRIDSTAFNAWQAERHYLKRQIIRSKLLAHGVFVEGELVGGLLWATPHFTEKKGLFGFDTVSLSNGHLLWEEEVNKKKVEQVLSMAL